MFAASNVFAAGAGSEQAFDVHWNQPNQNLINLESDITLTQPLGSVRGTDLTIDGLNQHTLTLLNNTLAFSPAGTALNATIQNVINVTGAANTAVLFNTAAGQTTNYNVINSTFTNNAGSAIRNVVTGGTNITNVWGTFSGNTAVNGGAIYNFAASGANSALNINDGSVFTGNSAVHGFAIYNDGFGVLNLNSDAANGGAGIRFSNNVSLLQPRSFPPLAPRNDIFQTATGVTNINISDTGGQVFLDGGFAGSGVINMHGGTGGDFYLAAASDNSHFTGTFNHFSGVTNVHGTMFGGVNNMYNQTSGLSEVNVFSWRDTFDYNANLFNNSTLNHFSSSPSRIDIISQNNGVSDGVWFVTGNSGATVSFNNATGDATSLLANYRLTNNLNNGFRNYVNFNFADVTFNSLSFLGQTVYTFNNSVIDLINSNAGIRQYSFTTLNTTGSTLDFKVLGDGTPFVGAPTDPGNYTTDTLLFSTEQNSTIDIGRLLIGNDLVAPLGGTRQVLFNQNPSTILELAIAGGGSSMYVFSRGNMYQLGLATTQTANDSITLGLINLAPPREVDLNDFNSTTLNSGLSAGANRAWQIESGTTAAPSVYNQPLHGPDSDSNPNSDTITLGGLGEMSAGIFSVHGTASDIDSVQGTVLSGFFDTANPTVRYSLFNIVNADTTFNLRDLTVSGAGINGGLEGGSVLRLDDGTSTANFNNVIIDNNIADGLGGAVRITEGTLNITNADFTNNQSFSSGGAISVLGGTVNIAGGLVNGISQNQGTSGGAIFQNAGILNISNQIFSANTASVGGGAIAVAVTGVANIVNTIFDGNTATSWGGAIFNNGNITIGGNTSFTNNTVLTALGGAINNTVSGVIGFDLTGGNILFNGNTSSAGNNDILNNGIIDITGHGGSMLLMGGVSGTGTINQDSEGILGNFGDSSGFTGVFNQTSGLTVNSGTFFGGQNIITGGTLYWVNNPALGTVALKAAGSSLQVSNGANLVVDGNSTLSLNNAADYIAYDSNIFLGLGSTISVEDAGAVLELEAGDIWAGTVNMSDGTVRMRALTNIANSDFHQTGGTLELFERSILTLGGTHATVTDGSILLDSSTINTNGAALNLLNLGGIAGWGNLTLAASFSDPDTGDIINPRINAIDGIINRNEFAGSMFVNGNTADFNIDIDAVNAVSDSFNFGGVIDPGTLNVLSVNLINAPRTTQVDMEVFSAAGGIMGIDFTTSQPLVWTPVGIYSFGPISGQDGWYRLNLVDTYWPVVRPQASKVAMLSSQLMANNIMFDHVFFDMNRMRRDANSCRFRGRYLPSEFFAEGRNRDMWVKTYFENQTIPVAGGLSMDNNLYGILTGIDFSVREFGENSYFMPTVYVGYTRAEQTFSSARMNQNALQAGGMLSAVINDVWTISGLAYVGAYRNQMSLHGNDDNSANNWFAGVGLRSTYNIYLDALNASYFFDNAILRPGVTLSYNYFGRQTVTSNHGDLRMQSGALSGLNVSPGLDFIYTADNWNFLAGVSYTHNIGNRVTGSVGDIELPTVEYRQDYFEYTLGVNRVFSDRFSAWVKCMVRANAGTDFGVRLGASWRL